MKGAALPFSSVRMLPVIHGFWLGYVRRVTVGTISSMMKPVTDVVYSSMPSEESRNIFQSVLAKQSCSLAFASSEHFFIDRVTALVFACKQESWNYGQICQMEGEGELCTRLCVWSKGGLEFFSIWFYI